jgi:hypothetical protein
MKLRRKTQETVPIEGQTRVDEQIQATSAEVIELAETERFFDSLTPGCLLEMPLGMTDEEVDDFKRRWRENADLQVPQLIDGVEVTETPMTREQAIELIAEWRATRSVPAARRAQAYEVVGLTPDQVRDLEALEEVSPEAIDQMTDEEAAALAAQEIQIPMIRLPLSHVNVNVVPDEDGNKHVFIGPVAITFQLPFTAEGARKIGRDLAGGVELAGIGVPPDLKVVD